MVYKILVRHWEATPEARNRGPLRFRLLAADTLLTSPLSGGSSVRLAQRLCLAAVIAVSTLDPTFLHAAGVQPGDIVVADVGSEGSGHNSALVIIDPKTGDQSLLSTGGLLDIPRGMVFDRVGQRFLVVNYATLIAVDAATGDQSFIASLPGLVDALAVEAPQQYLLSDYNGRLLRYNGSTGAVSVVASGGLIGGVAPWSVQIRDDGQIFVSALTAGGLDAPGLPSRVIQVDPDSGAQVLVFESLSLQLRDFVIDGDDLIIGTNSRGYPFPSGSDGVARLNILSGSLTPLYSGLERVLDVDRLLDGNLAILDQILTLTDIRSPVVYKAHKKHIAPLSIYGLMSIPARATVVQCFEDQDCAGPGKSRLGSCDLQGTCVPQPFHGPH